MRLSPGLLPAGDRRYNYNRLDIGIEALDVAALNLLDNLGFLVTVLATVILPEPGKDLFGGAVAHARLDRSLSCRSGTYFSVACALIIRSMNCSFCSFEIFRGITSFWR